MTKKTFDPFVTILLLPTSGVCGIILAGTWLSSYIPLSTAAAIGSLVSFVALWPLFNWEYLKSILLPPSSHDPL